MIPILLAYFALLLGVGWWVREHLVSGMTEFLLAGRRLGPVLCGAALAATHFGGGAILGGAAQGFQNGLSGAWYVLGAALGLVVLGLGTAHRLRSLSLYTVPDYLHLRYGGTGPRVVGATLSLTALVGILAAQVQAAGAAFAIIGLDETTATLLSTAVFLAYTVAGGLWAAVLTDFVQLAIAAGGTAIAATVAWGAASRADAGGVVALLEAQGVDSDFFSLTGVGWSAVLTLVAPTVLYTLIGQDFYQRLFAARDAATARLAALGGGVFLAFMGFFPVLVGMAARALGQVEDPSQALPWVLRELLPPALGGLTMAAILAAIMSTADSLLTSAASHVVKDLWVETFHFQGDERVLLRASRVAVLAVGCLSLLVGLVGPGIVETLILSYTLYTASAFVPVVGGLVWKRATRPAALTAMVVGPSAAIAAMATTWHPVGLPPEVTGTVLSAVPYVVLSMLFPKPQGA